MKEASQATRTLSGEPWPPVDDTVSTPSGAKTSASPRFDLLPHSALLRVARRYEKGLSRYGKDNWRKGLGDREYAIERISHIIEHCYRLIDKLEGRRIDPDDDAAAIAWGGLFLCEFMSALEEENETKCSPEPQDDLRKA